MSARISTAIGDSCCDTCCDQQQGAINSVSICFATRAVAAINDAQGTSGQLLRFAELTEASESGISATTLGL